MYHFRSLRFLIRPSIRTTVQQLTSKLSTTKIKNKDGEQRCSNYKTGNIFRLWQRFIEIKTAKNIFLDTLDTKSHFKFIGESFLSIGILNFQAVKNLQKLTFTYNSFVGYTSSNFGISNQNTFNSYFSGKTSLICKWKGSSN